MSPLVKVSIVKLFLINRVLRYHIANFRAICTPGRGSEGKLGVTSVSISYRVPDSMEVSYTRVSRVGNVLKVTTSISLGVCITNFSSCM